MKRNLICLVFLLVVFQAPAQQFTAGSMMNDHAFFQALSSFYWLKGYKVFPYISNTVPSGQNKTYFYNLYDCKSGELIREDIRDADLDDSLDHYHTVSPDEFTKEGNNALSKFKDDKATSVQMVQFASSNLNVSELSGTLQEQLINGFVDFLITAAKNEIKLSFFDQLKSLFDNEKYPELKTLFPETYSYVSSLDDIDLNGAFTALQTPIKTDLKNVLSNVKGLLSLEKYRNLIKGNEKLKPLVVVIGVLDVFNQLVIVKETNITNVVNQLFKDDIYMDAVYKTKAIEVFHGVSSLSENFSYLPSIVFRNKTLSDSWIDLETFNSYSKNDGFRDIFKYYLQKNLYDPAIAAAPTASDNDMALYRKTIRAMHDVGSAWFNYKKNKNGVTDDKPQTITSKPGKTATTDDKGLSAVLAGFKNLVTVTGSLMEANSAAAFGALKPDFELATAITGSSAKVIGFINNENYPLAVLEVSRLVFDQLNKRREQLVQDKKNAKMKDEKEGVTTQLSALNDFNVYSTKEKFLHYGLFLANVATADNSDEVSKAIETFALPPGSSRIKKVNKVTLGLNAYVGYSYSFNDLNKYPYLKKRESAVTAPLGLDLTFGMGRKVKWYMGVGATILDVGAIFSYKVKNDSTTVPDINFANIFSPGIKGHIGLPLFKNGWNIPLTLSGGYQWGPRIKSIDNLKVSTLPELVGRWQLSLAIDIPIVNFISVRK